jgi:hypothetical protein
LRGGGAQEPHHLWVFGSLISRLGINKEEERREGGTEKAETSRRRRRKKRSKEKTHAKRPRKNRNK